MRFPFSLEIVMVIDSLLAVDFYFFPRKELSTRKKYIVESPTATCSGHQQSGPQYTVRSKSKSRGPSEFHDHAPFFDGC